MASIHRKKLHSGRIVWELTHGRGQQRVRFVAGSTREEAEGVLAQFKRQLGSHGAPPATITIRHAASEFNEHLAVNRSAGTARRYSRVVKTFLLFLDQFCPGLVLLRDVKPVHVESYKRRRVSGEITENDTEQDMDRDRQLRRELAAKPRSPEPASNARYGWLGRKRLHEHVAEATINYELTVVHTFFRFAIRRNYCFANPVEFVERFRIPKKSVPKFLTREELQKFFAACADEEQRLFSTFLLTGTRRGEIEFLEWGDINFELGVMFVRAKEGWRPKTDERIIPISPTLRQVLLEQFARRRSDKWVFANRKRNRFSGRHLLEKMHRICRRAGIRPATLHELRHSFGAHLRMAGVNLADIADLLGHKNLATTQIYAKVQQEHLRSVISKLSPLLPDVARDASLECVTQGKSRAASSSNLLESGTKQEDLTGAEDADIDAPRIPASQPSPFKKSKQGGGSPANG
ncbi:tyrosine-type recombinase/integrase [Candidatus Uhrbacteria bacterium]|nr:tyrosine-type recombinase/integrase [Candidatus Uhrbacteria bacterium]